MNDTVPLGLYATSDFPLAVTLATLCAPPIYEETIFDADYLRRIGMTAEKAMEQGVRGKTFWVFLKSNEVEAAVDLFTATWRELDQGKNLELPDIPTPDLIRAAAMLFKNRGHLANAFKSASMPKVAIKKPDGSTSFITSKTPPDVLKKWGIVP